MTTKPLLKRLQHLLLACAAVASLYSLGGCASQQIDSYANQQPALDLQKYFSGTLDAVGVFTDRSGTVVKRFEVVIVCNWQGNEGTLDEDFTYSDGTKQKRIWHLSKQTDGRFIGRAADVVGQAFGEISGNALHWGYTLELPVDGRIYEMQFDDWMYQMNDRVMLNKATMSKFGVRLGEVTLSFNKRVAGN